MERRTVLAGLCLIAVTTGLRAQSGKIPRVGVLFPGSSKEPAMVQRDPFERGLRELGWVPGSNVIVDYRFAEGNAAVLPEVAGYLVRSGVDVIVARGNAAAHAARRATSTIPIVISASDDPVAEGLVKNLSRPGGNVTGIALIAFELDGKRIELLREAFPGIARIAVLSNPASESKRDKDRISALRLSMQPVNLQVEVFEVHRAEELPSAFAAMGRARVDALLVRGDPAILDQYRVEIAAAAARLKLPAVYWWRFMAEAGGLMSYGESIPAFHHRSATYVSRILKGEKPGELAIERPTKFELVVNLKTAKALGVEIPKSLLFRADDLIQ